MEELDRKILTNPSQTPYSKYGDKFMEGGQDMSKNPQQSSNPERAVNFEGRRVSKEALRVEWHKQFTQDELRNPDTRSTVKLAIDLGYSPSTVTSKDGMQIEAKQVIANSLLADQERLKKAEELLGRALTDEQKSAILKAHYEGKGEIGKNKEEAGVFNYTEAQLLRKTRTLRDEGGFSATERRSLIEAGLAAVPRVGITNGAILNEIAVIDAVIDSVNLPIDNKMQALNKGLESIQRLPGVSAAEKQVAINNIRIAIRDEAQKNVSQETKNQLRALKAEPNTPQKKARIIALLKDSAPQRDYLPSELLELATEYDDTFDYMVDKIISLPLSHETQQYSLGLASSVNLELIASVVSDLKNENSSNINLRDKYITQSEKLSTAQDSVKLLHEMNRLVRNGKLNEFIQIADSITPEQFNYLQTVPGVSAAMRLYEQAYDEFHTGNGWIFSEQMKDLNDSVMANLRIQNSWGVFGKEFEEWELSRAHAIAGKLYNTTLRSAEKIGTGTVPRTLTGGQKLERAREIEELIYRRRDLQGNTYTPAQAAVKIDQIREEASKAEMLGQHRYSSFPFESMGRIMNPIQLLIWRFEIGSDLSGSSMEFLKRVKHYYMESLKDRGEKLDINKITKLGGKNVEEMEYGGVFGVSGVYSGWRQENMFISKMEIGPNVGGRPMTVERWLADRTIDMESIKKRFGDAVKAKNNAGKRQAQNELATLLQPLINNLKVGRGILMKQGPFTGELGFEARKLLWQETARENIPLMISYLSGIQFSGGVNIPSFDQMARGVFGNNNHRIAEFKQKIMLEHEVRIRRIAMPNQNLALPVFDPAEQRLRSEIIAAGIGLAPHLSDIAFPYTPFLNDAHFEIFDYRVAGHEFFRRRLASDTPSFNTASTEFIGGLMDNPANKPEAVIEALKKIQRGIESPNGRPDGQKKVFPLAEAWLEWIMTRSGERHVALKSLKQSLLKHTSEAQKYSGMEAPSTGEEQSRKIIEHLEHEGVLSVELAEDLKKKKNLRLAGLFFAMFRDLFTTLIPAALLYSIGKESFKTAK